MLHDIDTKVFLTADIVALFIQVVGGVWASGDSETAAKDGGFVMLGGIAFQFRKSFLSLLLQRDLVSHLE